MVRRSGNGQQLLGAQLDRISAKSGSKVSLETERHNRWSEENGSSHPERLDRRVTCRHGEYRNGWQHAPSAVHDAFDHPCLCCDQDLRHQSALSPGPHRRFECSNFNAR